ncbi:Alpha/Beta hydrolase protein [Mycena pura]|uniref:Alpha/Beta hydrolase protein n=1 Tax=Mycena pura TaxID=153505 RepID=A0AAD6VP50_9AGAR|nr:Alpha/Beta hydrolase protein [Mycena pura]
MAEYAPYRHQPLKATYLLFELIAALVRVPYWALITLPPSWRPQKSWSWKRTLQIRLVRHFSLLSAKVGSILVSPNHLALVSGVGYHGVWVEPIESEAVVGKLRVWASAADVAPVRLPGYWLHKLGSTIELEAPLMPGEKIVYALHGGGYIRLSAHPSDLTAGIARGLLERVDSVHRTFSIEYRLSSTTPYPVANPFPTALLDALTGYNYLVNTLHISPSDIIVEGDSAGGNLGLALIRYLVEYPNPTLPVPGALLLLSPWCDLGTSHAQDPGSSYFTYRKTDYIDTRSTYSTHAFVGPLGLGAAEMNSYISPASTRISNISFAGFPPTFISAGGAEILRDSVRTLYQKMAKHIGEQVRYLEAKDSVHDYVIFNFQEPERGMTLTAIAEWVATL